MPMAAIVERFGPHTTPVGGAAVTPSDSTPVRSGLPCRAFMVTVAGAVSLITEDGSTVALPACQPGEVYQMMFTHVRATGTVATGIVALW